MNAKEIMSEIKISTSPEKLWDVLEDIDNYPQWNPLFATIDGEVGEGNTLDIRISPPLNRKRKFKLKITKCIPKLELSGKFFHTLPGVFDSEYRMSIVPLSSNSVRFSQRQIPSGMYVSVFKGQVTGTIKHHLDSMNRALKHVLERNGKHHS
jgi:hypothetical protein